MKPIVQVVSPSLPPLCTREVLRYAGALGADDATQALLQECAVQAEGAIAANVCYCELPLSIQGSLCEMGSLSLHSANLAKCLQHSQRVLLLCATVGYGIDRLLARYSRLSPARALLLQAIGSERIEALCDTFCEQYAREMGCTLTPRFSAGYGDLPLEAQREIFALLECSSHVGVYLNDRMLMTPSKSVTAFVGIL